MSANEASGGLARDTPLISVVMPVYDARSYLTEAVSSIQAQTYASWELIVVDDGSSDGSVELAAALAAQDARIRVLAVPHGGAAAAVNAGAKEAAGELIARMDADDVAVPERFAIQLDWMRRTGVEVCGSCVMRFGDETGLLWFPQTHDAIVHEMIFRHGLLQPAVLAHAAVFKEHGYRDGVRFEGNDLWIDVRRDFTLGNVPAALLRHRCHAGQTRVVDGPRMTAFVRSTRRPLFRDLFPEADDADADAIDRVAERQPSPTLADLWRAGTWLARLADIRDAELRRRMLARWRQACRNSATLGPGAYRLYRELAPEFGAEFVAPDRRLRFACATRVKPDSSAVFALASIKRRVGSHL